MSDVISLYYVSVVICLFLLGFIIISNNFDRKVNQCFLAATVCVLVLIIADIFEGRLAQMAEPSLWRVFFSAVGYTMRPASVMLIMLITIRYYPLKYRVLAAVPLVINVLVAFSALFCDAAFRYTADNQFERGPLGFTPFIVSGFYVIALAVVTIAHMRRGNRSEGIIVLVIAVNSVVATALSFLAKQASILCSCIAVNITFYYMFLHANQNNCDALTGVSSRRRFYIDAHKRSATLSSVLSLDLNSLKRTNDTEGHSAGDTALKTMADTISAVLPPKSKLYRTGGDEFMVLCHKMNEEQTTAVVRHIREAMERTPYRCAIGAAMVESSKALDEACNNADRAMYADKAGMKKGECYTSRYQAQHRTTRRSER